MEALPSVIPLDGENVLTGMVCPDCAGVIRVRQLGLRGHLEFTCRIGHLYALAELLVAKERDLEHRAWAAVHAAEEMSALMRDLLHDGDLEADSVEAFTQRRERATMLSRRLRDAIQNDRPVRLGTSEAMDGHGGDDVA